VQCLKARGNRQSNGDSLFERALKKFNAAHGLGDPSDSLPDVPTAPEPPKEKSTDELLLELGNLVTLDHLNKELEVEMKLLAKLDRLLKRFFQIRAMKPLIGLGDPAAPALASTTPVLELTAATDAPNTSGAPDQDMEYEVGTTDSVKSEAV
jgi:hypothetical protein